MPIKTSRTLSVCIQSNGNIIVYAFQIITRPVKCVIIIYCASLKLGSNTTSDYKHRYSTKRTRPTKEDETPTVVFTRVVLG